jgi:ATP-dependent Clp endopeptidase proteolytic subunit ClpP
MRPWYKITAKDDRAKILIYEQIGEDFFGDGVSAKGFVADLNALDVGVIDLYINSPGGNVFEGNAIYNALMRHRAEINVTIDGVAASIASVIAMAGSKITMPQNALMMIHDPSALVVGTAADMEKMIDALSRIKTGLISAYKTHSHASEEQIDEMMKNETWLTAQEAFDLGFATVVSKSVQMAANFDAFKYFRNVPDSVTGLTNQPIMEDKSMDITFDLIQSKHPEIVAEILKGVDIDYVRENLPEAVNKFKTEGVKEGAEAERTRVQAVREQSMPGHEALIDKLMFDGSTTGEQAAVKVLQAEKQIRSKMASDLKDDAPDPIEQPSTDDLDVDDSNLPIDQKCKSKWEKDKKLQNEFSGDFDQYLAYEKAVEAGKVKVLGG